MISVILFFLLLCSGSVLAAAFRGRRFEEVLPLTCTGIVLVLYVCGLLGALALGAALVCALAVCAYIAAGIRLCRTRGWKQFFLTLLSPPPLLFALTYLLLIFTHVGRLANDWDEFTHWMYIVKAMTLLDDFSTNPLCNDAFASYPPGMALFQYMFEKLYQWFDGGVMSEWRAFVSYQIFMFSFIWPFFSVLDYKKPFSLFVSYSCVILMPAIFLPNFYSMIRIDPFLGILFGAGMAHIFLRKKWDVLSALNIFFTCAMLVLAKDAGILPALFLAVEFCCVILLKENSEFDQGLSKRRKGAYVFCAALSVAFPRLSWSVLLKLTNTKTVFQEPLDFALIFRVITGRDTSPRAGVWEHFFRTFLREPTEFGRFGVKMSFGVLMLLFFAALGVLSVWYVKKRRVSSKKAVAFFLIFALSFFIFCLGLALTYISRFGDEEAESLSEYTRYMGIQFLGGLSLLVLLTIAALPEIRFRRTTAALLFAVIFALSPLGDVRAWLTRETIDTAKRARRRLNPVTELIETWAPLDSRIWVIDQGGYGYLNWRIHYIAFPRFISTEDQFTFGDPAVSPNFHSNPITLEEWQEQLRDSYDFVLIFTTNSYFMENFSDAFANPGDVAANTLFRVNKDTGLLEKCGP